MNSKNTLFILLSFFTFAQTVDAMLSNATKPFYMQRTKKLTNCNAMQLSMHSFSTKSGVITKPTNKDIGDDVNQVKSLENSIKTFMKLSKFEVIGNFCKKYAQGDKDQLLNLMKTINDLTIKQSACQD